MLVRAALLTALAAGLIAGPAHAQGVKGGPAPVPVPPPRAAPAGPPMPADLVACQRVEGASSPGTMEASGYRAALRDGRVATIVLDLPNGAASRTDFSPGRRDGTSLRLTAFPRQGQQGTWNTVFNLASLEPDGTVLVETWLGGTDRPGDAPRHNWYRIRCGGAPGPAPIPAPGAGSVAPGTNPGGKG